MQNSKFTLHKTTKKHNRVQYCTASQANGLNTGWKSQAFYTNKLQRHCSELTYRGQSRSLLHALKRHPYFSFLEIWSTQQDYKTIQNLSVIAALSLPPETGTSWTTACPPKHSGFIEILKCSHRLWQASKLYGSIKIHFPLTFQPC